jgi:hypothetical protein
MIQYPHTMLNPGELVKGHYELTHKCFSCHEPFWGIANDKCIACHKLSEIGKNIDTSIYKKNITFHKYLENQKCTSCHTDHKGIKPVISINIFKHDIFSSTVINDCKNCHIKPANNLHKQLSDECSKCHYTKSWKLSSPFNHEQILNADKNKCLLCHQKPVDIFHESITDNCSKCHTTNKWKPASYDHSASFQLDNHHNTKCNICHTNNNYKIYTCYGCHEHSESNIREAHIEEGIIIYNNCIFCHKSRNNKFEIEDKDKSNIKSNEKADDDD